ncbi:MAG: hypothetical protein HON90_06040, partial [Halobacteriovoraceae bacterium]|nr:hypothetical protein [Halobacteriovoraceae bacterium]
MKLMLLIALFFLQNSYAFERYFYQSSQGQHIIVTYPESGKWVLEEFLVKPGKLQEKIVSKFFSSEKNLLKHKDSFYKKTNFQKDIRTHYFNSSEVTNSSIWKVTEHWDLNWEKKYSQWVDSEFDKNFFVKYNVATDCADVAFALRWIFSRINGLPAANTLAGSHIIFSHESLKKEWQSLPTHTEWHKDLRFLAGLNYLLSNAFTGTLNIDGYPIEITTDAFNVGTIHLLGGHTQIISKIDTSGDTAPIWKLSSTVPMKVRVLFEELMLDQTPTAQAYGGLFHMRWPSKESGTWKLIAKEKMPYYSIEQYGSDFIGNSGSFTLAIIDRLNIPFNPKAVIKNAATTLVEMIKSRVDIVRDGHKYCSAADCREGSFNYEEYSTPTRDGRIKNQFSTIDDLIAKFTSMDPNLASFWTQFQKTTMILIEGASKSLAAYRMIFERKLASYHPDDSINERWALDRNASFSAFNKKMNRIISKREGLVLSGKACVNNQSCAQGSQLWEEHNTYVFDQELRDSGYATFFYLKKMYGDSTLKSYLSEELIKTLYSIPKMISEPTVSLIKRRGMHHVDMFHLGLISKRLIEINFDTYIIDNTIINLAMNSKIYSGLGSYVLLDDTHQQVISLKNSKVTLIDAVDGVEFDSVRVQDNVNRINWLGDSVFGVSDCQSNMTDPNQTVKCSLMLYKVAQKKITQLMVLNDIDPFSVLNFTQNYKMSGFHQGVFVDLTSNQSIYISNGNIHQIPLADEEYQLNYSAVSATNKTFHILEFRSKVNNKISK